MPISHQTSAANHLVHRVVTLFLIALCAVSAPAISQNASQKIVLAGVMGSKALLVIDGAAPRLLGLGEVHAGVKVISASGEEALLEIAGKRAKLRVGDAPVSFGSSAGAGGGGGNKITLPVGSGGHFMANGTINGRTIQFMVDTGATSIAIGASDAQRLGIDYQKGQPVRMSTANGVAQGWRVVLSSVRVGEVEIYGVDAVVGPNMPFALLGNSFLSRFSMNRTSDVMVLERRY